MEMEEEEIENVDAPLCRCCQEPYKLGDDFCNNCGFPFNGTEKEQGQYIGKFLVGVHNETEGQRNVKRTRNALFIIAGILMVGGLMTSEQGNEGAIILVGNTVLAFIFLMIAMWSDKSPFNAYLTGLLIFLSAQVIGLIISPASIFSGLILKMIIISFLISGLVGAASSKQKQN